MRRKLEKEKDGKGGARLLRPRMGKEVKAIAMIARMMEKEKRRKTRMMMRWKRIETRDRCRDKEQIDH